MSTSPCAEYCRSSDICIVLYHIWHTCCALVKQNTRVRYMYWASLWTNSQDIFIIYWAILIPEIRIQGSKSLNRFNVVVKHQTSAADWHPVGRWLILCNDLGHSWTSRALDMIPAEAESSLADQLWLTWGVWSQSTARQIVGRTHKIGNSAAWLQLQIPTRSHMQQLSHTSLGFPKIINGWVCWYVYIRSTLAIAYLSNAKLTQQQWKSQTRPVTIAAKKQPKLYNMRLQAAQIWMFEESFQRVIAAVFTWHQWPTCHGSVCISYTCTWT